MGRIFNLLYLYFDAQATLQDLIFTGSKYPDSFSIYNALPLDSATLPFILRNYSGHPVSRRRYEGCPLEYCSQFR